MNYRPRYYPPPWLIFLSGVAVGFAFCALT